MTCDIDFDPHMNWLHHRFRRRGVDGTTCDDLVQETLIEAWRHRAKLRDGDSTRPWLAAIANNILLRWYRESSRQPYALNDDFDAPDDLHLDSSIEMHELRSLVHCALKRLPASDRTSLIDRYAREFTVANVGASMGVSAAHAAVHLQRARFRLRDVLRAEFAADLEAFGYPGRIATWRSSRL